MFSQPTWWLSMITESTTMIISHIQDCGFIRIRLPPLQKWSISKIPLTSHNTNGQYSKFPSPHTTPMVNIQNSPQPHTPPMVNIHNSPQPPMVNIQNSPHPHSPHQWSIPNSPHPTHGHISQISLTPKPQIPLPPRNGLISQIPLTHQWLISQILLNHQWLISQILLCDPPMVDIPNSPHPPMVNIPNSPHPPMVVWYPKFPSLPQMVWYPKFSSPTMVDIPNSPHPSTSYQWSIFQPPIHPEGQHPINSICPICSLWHFPPQSCSYIPLYM